MENEEIRNKILKIGIVAAGTIAVAMIMYHFLGILGVLALPIGVFLAVSGQ